MKVDLRPIKTRRDYLAALKEAESLWDASTGSKQADRLEVLVAVWPGKTSNPTLVRARAFPKYSTGHAL